MRFVLVFLLLLAGCSPASKSSSKAASEADANASQGTSTVPIIIICNQLITSDMANNAHCIQPNDKTGETLKDVVIGREKKDGKTLPVPGK